MISTAASIHRLSLEDVLAMVEAGILTAEDRVELVDGVLVEMSPIGPNHSTTVSVLNRWLVKSLENHEVRIQDGFVIPGGFLEPDVMVLEPLANPREEMVHTALLVVEVAETSLARDREKAADYAAAGVGEYWIVDLRARAVHVHRNPGDGVYATVEERRDGELAPPVGAPPIAVTDLFR